MTAATADRLPTVAVILAGGTGARVGLDIPKQLLKLAGRTIIEHTVESLNDCEDIDDIIVMMANNFVADAERLLRTERLAKVSAVLPGGDDRNASASATSSCMTPCALCSRNASCGRVWMRYAPIRRSTLPSRPPTRSSASTTAIA
jgi:2-C-methyl-D-erythritol 4-phosphate cytidylyltransferase